MLQNRHGRWMLDERPLEDGDLVEVRKLHLPPAAPDGKGVDIDEWYPAVVFDGGRSIELEDATDASWSRSAQPRSADVHAIARSGAELRRRGPT